jgi:hypothetical protein
MDQWIDFGKNFGIPLLMLGGLAYFLVKYVWPFVTDQIKEAQVARKQEIEKFVETIRLRDVQAHVIQEKHLKALEAMTRELRSVKEELRNNK